MFCVLKKPKPHALTGTYIKMLQNDKPIIHLIFTVNSSMRGFENEIGEKI